MATVSYAYQAPSGGIVYMGLPEPSANIATYGDSITTDQYSPYFMLNALLGGKMRMVANCGYSGDTIQQMLARVDNAYNPGASNSGLGGLPPLRRVLSRGGSNNATLNQAIATIQSAWESLLWKQAGYAADHVVVLACPPHSNYARSNEYNAFLASFCAAHTSQFIWIDDCSGCRDGSGAPLSVMYPDIHPSPTGIYQMAHDGAAAYSSYVSNWVDPRLLPLGTDQWFANPYMAGTGGGKSGFSGTVCNNLSVIAYGNFAGVCSIVPADVGDPIQVPYLDIEFTQGAGGGHATRIESTTGSMANRPVTDIDPSRMDLTVEYRTVNLDMSKIARIRTSLVTTSNGDVLPGGVLPFKSSGLSNEVFVYRSARPRATTPGASAFKLFVEIEGATSFGPAVSAGHLQCRLITARG